MLTHSLPQCFPGISIYTLKREKFVCRKMCKINKILKFVKKKKRSFIIKAFIQYGGSLADLIPLNQEKRNLLESHKMKKQKIEINDRNGSMVKPGGKKKYTKLMYRNVANVFVN